MGLELTAFYTGPGLVKSSLTSPFLASYHTIFLQIIRTVKFSSWLSHCLAERGLGVECRGDTHGTEITLS